MNPKLAQVILIIVNLLAIPAVGYPIYDYVSVNSAIADGTQQIPFDSGIYYLLLMSVFWVFSYIQIVGSRGGEVHVPKFAAPLGIGWFIAMLILANVIPYYLQSELESTGYVKCNDPSEISRVSRGESSIYMKGGCGN